MVKITDLPGGALLLALVFRIYLCFDGIYGAPWIFIQNWSHLIRVYTVRLQEGIIINCNQFCWFLRQCGMTRAIAGACARDVLFPCLWPVFEPTEEELIGINLTIVGLP